MFKFTSTVVLSCLTLFSTASQAETYTDGFNAKVYQVTDRKNLDKIGGTPAATFVLTTHPFSLTQHAPQTAISGGIAYQLDGYLNAEEEGTYNLAVKYDVNVPTTDDSKCYTHMEINGKEVLDYYTNFLVREKALGHFVRGYAKLNPGMHKASLLISCVGISDYNAVTVSILVQKPSMKVATNEEMMATPKDFQHTNN